MPDNDASAGATPAVAPATGAQSTPAQPAASTTTPPTPPATDDTDGLGDAGKRAIDRMKAERDAAKADAAAEKKRADELELATKSDSDRAVAAAKAAGASEASSKFVAAIRRSEVRTALTGAGITTSVLDLAVKSDEFEAIKVSDEGVVDAAELADTVKAFKKARPDLFGKPSNDGSADGGAGTTGAPKAGSIEDAITAHYSSRT